MRVPDQSPTVSNPASARIATPPQTKQILGINGKPLVIPQSAQKANAVGGGNVMARAAAINAAQTQAAQTHALGPHVRRAGGGPPANRMVRRPLPTAPPAGPATAPAAPAQAATAPPAAKPAPTTPAEQPPAVANKERPLSKAPPRPGTGALRGAAISGRGRVDRHGKAEESKFEAQIRHGREQAMAQPRNSAELAATNVAVQHSVGVIADEPNLQEASERVGLAASYGLVGEIPVPAIAVEPAAPGPIEQKQPSAPVKPPSELGVRLEKINGKIESVQKAGGPQAQLLLKGLQAEKQHLETLQARETFESLKQMETALNAPELTLARRCEVDLGQATWVVGKTEKRLAAAEARAGAGSDTDPEVLRERAFKAEFQEKRDNVQAQIASNPTLAKEVETVKALKEEIGKITKDSQMGFRMVDALASQLASANVAKAKTASQEDIRAHRAVSKLPPASKDPAIFGAASALRNRVLQLNRESGTTECMMNGTFMDTDKKSPARHEQELALFVKLDVLDAKGRERNAAITRWISTAVTSIHMQDYASAKAISDALNTPPLDKLAQRLDSKQATVLQTFKDLFAATGTPLNKALELDPGAIPPVIAASKVIVGGAQSTTISAYTEVIAKGRAFFVGVEQLKETPGANNAVLVRMDERVQSFAQATELTQEELAAATSAGRDSYGDNRSQYPEGEEQAVRSYLQKAKNKKQENKLSGMK